MVFDEVADPEQVAVLSEVFEAYCQSRDITEEADRDAAAARILSLFNFGITTIKELNEALDRVDPDQDPLA
jgi:hypothetical protein